MKRVIGVGIRHSKLPRIEMAARSANEWWRRSQQYRRNCRLWNVNAMFRIRRKAFHLHHHQYPGKVRSIVCRSMNASPEMPEPGAPAMSARALRKYSVEDPARPQSGAPGVHVDRKLGVLYGRVAGFETT